MAERYQVHPVHAWHYEICDGTNWQDALEWVVATTRKRQDAERICRLLNADEAERRDGVWLTREQARAVLRLLIWMGSGVVKDPTQPASWSGIADAITQQLERLS